MLCIHCGAINSKDDKICVKCGKNIYEFSKAPIEEIISETKVVERKYDYSDSLNSNTGSFMQSKIPMANKPRRLIISLALLFFIIILFLIIPLFFLSNQKKQDLFFKSNSGEPVNPLPPERYQTGGNQHK
jgi:uncharacterized membrane protein YvbJ